ncbi:ADP-ribosylglycohydrolase family protein [Thermostaphylospora chromogena]|uniref:ADP-ribosylglycohydrolase n=1 Tax=Thermostaphylospora chromogena TaxID=35622 RepID=A0A1H1GUJ0_9ACTN|nr:ADP-ribosylglycohydrolase family protein [Thermostaphylospora chromogena]SDR16809.1 ADP-ribosylglycohydrolase [Thermostaphylospora chromogena]
MRDRIRGAFIGLAIGDAAGWPARRHRAALLAPWTRRLGRELDAFAEEHAVTTLPVPFALNQPVAPLAVGPSDDAEWLAWTARTLGRDRAEAFGELSGRPGVRARISVRTALDNLAAGVKPPASGHDNPHFFDDAAAVRAVAYGAAGADPRADAEVTNAGDGVLAALAVAAAVREAVRGGDVHRAVEAALAELPPDTAIGAAARLALEAAGRAEDAFAAVPALDAALDDHVYSYGVAAAQTVPAALALAVAARGGFASAVSAAACLPALADSAPALTGALTGALSGYAALPERWREAARTLAGCCLPDLAGTDLAAVADDLAASTTNETEDDDEGAG